MLLSEDFEARRVASATANMEAVSIHRLLHRRVHSNKMSAHDAASLAAMLGKAGRAQEATAEEFADPTGRSLGRWLRP